MVEKQHGSFDLLQSITTLSGEFLVTNWLPHEQQMLRDVGFSIQNPHD